MLDRRCPEQMKRRRTLAGRLASSRAWWRAYRAYLLSPAWHDKRLRVMRRNNWVCEHCGMRQAVQVHHYAYPQGCVPGSKAWQAQERLADLAAVCERCHSGLHPRT